MTITNHKLNFPEGRHPSGADEAQWRVKVAAKGGGRRLSFLISNLKLGNLAVKSDGVRDGVSGVMLRHL